MRFRNHTLEIHYLPGSSFRIINGKIYPRKPTLHDIDYVRAIPDDGGTAVNFKSVSEAKQFILNLDKRETPT